MVAYQQHMVIFYSWCWNRTIPEKNWDNTVAVDILFCYIAKMMKREIWFYVSWDKFSTTRVKYYYNTNHRQDIAWAIVDLDPYVVTGSQCVKCSYSVLAYFQPHIHSMGNKLWITGPSITVMSNERNGFQITGHSIVFFLNLSELIANKTSNPVPCGFPSWKGSVMRKAFRWYELITSVCWNHRFYHRCLLSQQFKVKLLSLWP